MCLTAAHVGSSKAPLLPSSPRPIVIPYGEAGINLLKILPLEKALDRSYPVLVAWSVCTIDVEIGLSLLASADSIALFTRHTRHQIGFCR